MLTTLLSNLQTLISTRFVVVSFFPTLAFWFAHAAMLFLFNAPFETYVRSNVGQTAGLTTLLVSAALIGVAFSAYAEHALLPTIQSLMEGNWPQWLASFFAPSQMKTFERLNSEIAQNLRLRGAFGTTAGGRSQAQVWQETLTNARIMGNGVATNKYTMREASAKEVAKLARLRRSARAIPGNSIISAVTRFALDLRANNADQPGPYNDHALENTRQLLWDLIEYADQYAAAQYRSLVMTRQFSFGALPLAPTRMGNVARTVQTYAIERYDFNFVLLWSRMQLPAQKDKDFSPVLQAAKTQLDFLISCSALTFLWALPWAVWLYISSGPPLLFLAVALLGPLVTYAWYRAAVAHYRTFADVLRSSVDLFRFDLLAALHYPRPDGVHEERDLWKNIDALHALYELRDFRYTHPKSS